MVGTLAISSGVRDFSVALAFAMPATVASDLEALISNVQNQNVVHKELVEQGNVLLQNLVTEFFHGLDIS
jgi:hypothetical protein